MIPVWAPDTGPGRIGPRRAVEELGGAIRVCVDDLGHGALHFRAHFEGLVRAHQVALLLDAADGGEGEAAEDAKLAAAATFLTRQYLDRDYRPERDPRFTATIDRLLGTDVDVCPLVVHRPRFRVPGVLQVTAVISPPLRARPRIEILSGTAR